VVQCGGVTVFNALSPRCVCVLQERRPKERLPGVSNRRKLDWTGALRRLAWGRRHICQKLREARNTCPSLALMRLSWRCLDVSCGSSQQRGLASLEGWLASVTFIHSPSPSPTVRSRVGLNGPLLGARAANGFVQTQSYPAAPPPATLDIVVGIDNRLEPNVLASSNSRGIGLRSSNNRPTRNPALPDALTMQARYGNRYARLFPNAVSLR
jgi:hypothetical protein